MFPFVQGRHPEIDRLAGELLQEHRQVQDLTGQLRFEENLSEKLNQLGTLLEAHIRKEERVFFPLVQDHLSEADLQALQTRIEQAQAYLNQPPYIT